MATQTAGLSPAPSAQVVGNAFVLQYYRILHQSPELVYRFYQDSSVLSRPGVNGVMMSVTTMQGINDKILSLDCKNYKAEIMTADAQVSFNEGVTVLVTGCLTGKDDVRRKFAQSFFLAPQDTGFFVLNDVFRYVDESESLGVDTMVVSDVDENVPTGPLTPEPTHVADHSMPNHTTTPVEEDTNNGEEVCDPSDNEDGSVIEEEVVAELMVDSSQNNVSPVSESAPSNAQEDAPKKTYASIVKVMKGNVVTAPVYVPTSTVRVAPANTDQKLRASATPAAAPEARAPSSNSAPENSNDHTDVKGHSIYIRNLPLNATVEQLEGVFKKFGPIKPDGIQVRSYKLQGFCFGFVEFESASSVRSAIEASPVTIGGHQSSIEEKRVTLRVGNGRGRFPPGRGGFRNDNFGGRGNYNGARSYGRNEFGNRGEFSGRARGPTGRNGVAYQRVYQNGGGRVAPNGGTQQTGVSA